MLRPTRAGLAALALAAPALAGCSFASAQTSRPYDPSDGVSASVGSVQVRNLLIVGSTAQAPGVVSGVLLNEGAQPVTLTLAAGTGAPVPVDLPAGTSVQLGVATTTAPVAGTPGAAVVQFAALGQPAGAVVPVTLSSAAGGTTTVQVPILAATLEYATITPAPVPAPS